MYPGGKEGDQALNPIDYWFFRCNISNWYKLPSIIQIGNEPIFSNAVDAIVT